MDKFIMAGGCALRIRDILPRGEAGKAAGQAADGDGAAEPESERDGQSGGEHGGNGKGGGEKPTLLLLHGYFESLEVWEQMTPFLHGHARIISLDIPGHGISEVCSEVHTMEFLADTVFDALRNLGVGKCFVVGHSMGGYVALELLRRHPQAVEGLVLLHSTPNPDTEEKRQMRLRETEIVRAGKKELLMPSVDRAFAAENRKRLADDIADLREMAELTEDEGITALLAGMMERADNNEMMRGSDTPQLFIFGRGDELIPQPVADKIIEDHPRAQVVWLERSGHMGLIEQPEEAAAAIVGFMEKHA